jgi:integrase
MTTELTISTNAGSLGPALDVARLGRAANQAGARHVFADYRSRKADNTLRRQDAGLALFAEYLGEVGADVGALTTDPEAWRGITWGLVETFTRWMLARGYAVGSANVRLSTVKTYAKLAAKAGILDAQALAMIQAVGGFSHKEGKRIDERRQDAGLPTRRGSKKAEAVSLGAEQVRALKDQPDTPQGRRDRLIMCLLLDHGLRVGELAGLTVGAFDLKAGELRFYREKVDKVQTHRLTPDALDAARSYLAQDAPPIGPLLRASRKDGRLTDAGLTSRRISERVRVLGQAVGVDGLSAHDCRHSWATQAARAGTPIDRLQDAGGWASPSMPLRYVEAAAIANQGVRLG